MASECTFITPENHTLKQSHKNVDKKHRDPKENIIFHNCFHPYRESNLAIKFWMIKDRKLYQ